MTFLSSLGIIVLTSAVIYFSGDRFATASSRIGDHFKLPRSVKGVTLDAISSSFPELMIAIFSLVYFHRFDVGVGAIAGSAVFNLLVIPGISVLVAPVVFKVSKEVVYRDGLFYTGSVIALIIGLLISRTWGLIIPLIFIACYLVYVGVIAKDTQSFQKSGKAVKDDEGNIYYEIWVAVGNLIAIALASFFLTESSIGLAHALNIPAILIAFTVAAASTSISDAVISVANAKKGDVTDSASNVFGSNIFDIFIGLSVPVIIAFFMFGGPVDIEFENMEILYGLLAATLLVLWFFKKKLTLEKKHAWILLGLYLLFVLYIVFLAFFR